MPVNPASTLPVRARGWAKTAAVLVPALLASYFLAHTFFGSKAAPIGVAAAAETTTTIAPAPVSVPARPPIQAPVVLGPNGQIDKPPETIDIWPITQDAIELVANASRRPEPVVAQGLIAEVNRTYFAAMSWGADYAEGHVCALVAASTGADRWYITVNPTEQNLGGRVVAATKLLDCADGAPVHVWTDRVPLKLRPLAALR